MCRNSKTRWAKSLCVDRLACSRATYYWWLWLYILASVPAWTKMHVTSLTPRGVATLPTMFWSGTQSFRMMECRSAQLRHPSPSLVGMRWKTRQGHRWLQRNRLNPLQYRGARSVMKIHILHPATMSSRMGWHQAAVCWRGTGGARWHVLGGGSRKSASELSTNRVHSL